MSSCVWITLSYNPREARVLVYEVIGDGSHHRRKGGMSNQPDLPDCLAAGKSADACHGTSL